MRRASMVIYDRKAIGYRYQIWFEFIAFVIITNVFLPLNVMTLKD